MKKSFLHYIKLCFALLLFLQVGKVSGQITVTGGNADIIYANTIANPCGDVTGATLGTAGLLNYSSAITVTSGTAVTSMSFLIGSIGDNTIESHRFDAQGITNELLSVPSTCSSLLTISGNTIANISSANSVVTRVTVSSVTPFTQVVITKLSQNGLFFVSGSVKVCNAGTTAPTLSATTIANACPTATFNLNSLVTSATPSGASLKWFTDNTHTTAVADPTAVASSGTYYAFYYDATNNCYSPASSAVTGTISSCPINISNACPSLSVDLAASLASGHVVPTGYTLTFHSGTPATAANKLASSVVTTAGTYYGAYYFAAQDCFSVTGRPLVVTIANCCATLTPPTFN